MLSALGVQLRSVVLMGFTRDDMLIDAQVFEVLIEVHFAEIVGTDEI
jgi:hypothetical protein